MDVIDGVVAGRGAGQAATWLPQLAMAWESQREFDIHWCVLDRHARRQESKRKWGQTFHAIPSPGISVSLLLARWPQRRIYGRLLGQLDVDLVHCWGSENLHGAALGLASVPSILSMQGVIHAIYKTGDLKGWRWRLFKYWEKVSIRKADYVTCESNWALRRVAEIVGGKPMKRIEYGVFPGFYEVPWRPLPDCPEFLFVGSACHLKGVDILLEMLRRNPRRGWKMVFAGGGELEPALMGLMDPNVEVLGKLRTNELQDRMARAWALAHPSRADSSPNAVKEARVIGLPVVASPNGGHSEYVHHGVDGIAVGSDNPDDWFEALDGLARDYWRCREMGRVNHERYREHFQPIHTAEGFMSLYREILRPGGEAAANPMSQACRS